MMGRTHKKGGTNFGLGVIILLNSIPAITLNPILTIPFLVGSTLGAYIPDFDSTTSTISKKLWFILWPIWLLQKIINFFTKGSKSELAKNIRKSANHRGLAHWPSIYIIGFFLVKFIQIFISNFLHSKIDVSSLETIDILKYLNFDYFESLFLTVIAYFIYGLLVGALSHIFLDALNDRGVPLLAPLSYERINFASIVTNSKREKRFRGFLTLTMYILTFIVIGQYLLKLQNLIL